MSGPNKSSLISFVLMSSTMEARFSSERQVSCSADFVVLEGVSRCLEFLCFVKPPFDFQIFAHWGQGNDFLPAISLIASTNSASSRFLYQQQQRKHRDCMIQSRSSHLAFLRGISTSLKTISGSENTISPSLGIRYSFSSSISLSIMFS